MPLLRRSTEISAVITLVSGQVSWALARSPLRSRHLRQRPGFSPICPGSPECWETSVVFVPTLSGFATPLACGGKWTGCRTPVASPCSEHQSAAPKGCRSKYADPQLEVYPFFYVAAAAEQSAPTARLPIPHPLP
jgi:hypothetical protein